MRRNGTTRAFADEGSSHAMSRSPSNSATFAPAWLRHSNTSQQLLLGSSLTKMIGMLLGSSP